jgi:hypothetical protein
LWCHSWYIDMPLFIADWGCFSAIIYAISHYAIIRDSWYYCCHFLRQSDIADYWCLHIIIALYIIITTLIIAIAITLFSYYWLYSWLLDYIIYIDCWHYIDIAAFISWYISFAAMFSWYWLA